ncbi:hypothetical protein [Sphingopyxis sp.]|uniref:hypothetical protein n=1 Tax=Sphingopyxis sp. TaxID=1908224 RepID=UPI00345044D7
MSEPRRRRGARVLRERLGADRAGLVHGRMKGPDKDDVMARFRAGKSGRWSRQR